jgi:hypothetical protein
MKYNLLVAAFALSVPCAASAQTTMPLNTGYNYSMFSLDPIPGTVSNIPDNYWIKIASYEPPATSVPIAAAWVLNPTIASWLTLPNARWVGPQPTGTSGGGSSQTNPAYSIYRKCFCLMAGYQNPALSFQLRADNESNAWLNGITNVLVPPSPDSYNTTAPINSRATTPAMFHVGLNCIYVLVQNRGGPTGFTLAGSVSALGLMPIAGAGAGNSFAPCQCGRAMPATAAGAQLSSRSAEAEDSATVRAIVAFAEAQRRRAGGPR